MSIIFESANLKIESFLPSGSTPSRVVLVYTSLLNRSLVGNPAGGAVLVSAGYAVISLKSSADGWFQDIPPEAIRAVQEHLRKVQYQRILAYGSSMGAFAAIAFSGAFDCDHVLALSPQFRIDTEFDTRWQSNSRQVRWHHRIDSETIGKKCAFTVVYDPMDLDRWHARQLGTVIPATRFRSLELRYAGHPATLFLHEVGKLRTLLLAAIEGAPLKKFDWRSGKGRSRSYLKTLCAAAEARGAWPTALGLLNRLLHLTPNDLGLQLRRVSVLEAAGRMGDATQLLEELDRKGSGTADLHAKLAQWSVDQGDTQRAHYWVKRGLMANYMTASLHHLASRLADRRGSARSSLEAAKRAFRLSPDHAHVSGQLAAQLLRTGRVRCASFVIEQGTRLNPDFPPLTSLRELARVYESRRHEIWSDVQE